MDSLVVLTFVISPDELDGKVIFCVSDAFFFRFGPRSMDPEK